MYFLRNIISIMVLFVVMFSTSFADKVEIVSDSMKAENMKKEVHFIGHVKITQSNNWLHGDQVIVYFNENNETDKYVALGSVLFEFKKEQSFYKGSANKVTYYPSKSQYVLEGKAIIDDKINKRHVNGNMIIFDALTGNANVKGNARKPVKFIFDMKDKK